jgi:acetate kinase
MDLAKTNASAMKALVLNAGSSSLKWALLTSDGTLLGSGNEPAGADIGAIIARAGGCDAVGHREVHGGTVFRRATRIDAEVRQQLNALVEIDRLHMPPALAGIDAVSRALPETPQVAAFDTAFHATIPEAAASYGVPFEWRERYRARRFGFHGLSVDYSVGRTREMLGHLPERLVVCHLGSGCSLTAVREGKSVDTTMGFSPLEGVMMSTRSGSIDPGLLLYLAGRADFSLDELSQTLSHRSGWLGVSGLSADLREVIAAAGGGNARAQLAYDMFICSLRRALGAMVGSLGGIDAVVFTGGVGENSARVRKDVAEALRFCGLFTSDTRIADDARISTADSKIVALVVHAREDLVILREVLELA